MIDQKQIDAVIREAHAGVFSRNLETFKDEMLAGLKPLIPFDTALWASGVQEPQLIYGIATHRFPIDRLIEYATLWQPHDALRAAAAARSGTALRNEDLGPIAVYHGSTIYRDYCQPSGIEHALAVTIIDPVTQVGELIFLFRSTKGAFYSDAERDALGHVMPHLLLAWQHRLYLHVRERSQKPKLPGAAMPTGFAVVDDLGQVHASDKAFGEAIRAEFSDWTGPLLPPRLVGHLRDKQKRCNIGGKAFSIELGVDRHLLLFNESTLAITAAELRVARSYAEGRTAAEVASELGISPLTVRNHLTAIYAKLRVNSKLALARLLALHD